MSTLLRSNIEFSKRLFLDRLTVDAQPLLQPDKIDAGPGDEYDYGATYDPYDFGVGADCSGASGIEVGAAILGAAKMKWGRVYTTEDFPGPFRDWFRKVDRNDLLTGRYPIKVAIHRGGGGPNSHMNTWIDGWLMESNGDHGTCTLNYGAIPQDSNYWTDFYVCDASIQDDTDYRQPMGYPQGLDYAGGRLSGSVLAAAGISFVCRYLTDGGLALPGKLLTGPEFADLQSNGIAVVFNYETTANFMLSDNGTVCAQRSLDTVRALPNGPAEPVVYFSCDFDESPEQQDTINRFCADAQKVLPGRVGLYGPYYCLKRAKDAGVVNYLWQTEAWSGFGTGQQPHIDSRVNIVQRNKIGYKHVAGVECDVNEAHSPNFGQWLPGSVQPTTPVPNSPPQVAFTYPPDHDMLVQVWEQLFGVQAKGWESLFGKSSSEGRARYTVEGVADVRKRVMQLQADVAAVLKHIRQI